jgi:hypothetical protein
MLITFPLQLCLRDRVGVTLQVHRLCCWNMTALHFLLLWDVALICLGSIGYGKFVYTMDKVIRKWGHVTQKAFILGLMTLVIPVRAMLKDAVCCCQLQPFTWRNYASYRKTHSS